MGVLIILQSVYLCVHPLWVHVCEGLGLMSGVFADLSPSYCWASMSQLNPEIICTTSLASQLAPAIPTLAFWESWSYKDTATPT